MSWDHSNSSDDAASLGLLKQAGTDTSSQIRDLKLQVAAAFTFHPPCNPGDGFTNAALPKCLDPRCATVFLLMRFKL